MREPRPIQALFTLCVGLVLGGTTFVHALESSVSPIAPIALGTAVAVWFGIRAMEQLEGAS